MSVDITHINKGSLTSSVHFNNMKEYPMTKKFEDHCPRSDQCSEDQRQSYSKAEYILNKLK